jgi:hypothetical protein
MKKSLIKVGGNSLNKLKDLQEKYISLTGRHITLIEIVSKLIDKSKLEDLGK